jgi:hypothetical protein
MPIDPRIRPASPAARRPDRLRGLAVAGGTTVALLAAAAPSQAAETTAKTTGTTTIKLSGALKSVLKRSRVSVSGVSPARRGATAIKLPLTSATVDPEAGSGTLNHAGALRFKRGRRSLTVKSFRVAVASSGSSVTVGIGSGRVRMFTVDTTGVKIAQTSKRLTVSGLGVKLTPIGASRLNRALGVTRFRSGTSLGVASAAIAVPGGSGATGAAATSGTTLRGGTSTLTLTPEARAGARAGGASFSTVAPATGGDGGPFAFPITGGALDGAKRFAGSATLAGALQVTFAGQTYVLSDPVVDTASRKLTAVFRGSRVDVFALDLGAVRDVAYDNQLVLDGIGVRQSTTGPFGGTSNALFGTLRIDATTD